jgi:tetratricopeptide (TPR) repeat protein
LHYRIVYNTNSPQTVEQQLTPSNEHSMAIRAWTAMAILASLLAAGLSAQPGASAEQVKELLLKEPITEKSWPTWSRRLDPWLTDTGKPTAPAIEQAERFLLGLADAEGRLEPQYYHDYVAWYLLGNSYLHEQPPRPEGPALAENAFRRAVAIRPKSAAAHRNLALALIMQARPTPPGETKHDPRLQQAERSLNEATRLDPAVPLLGIDATLAQRRGQFTQAATLFEKALQHDPNNVGLARQLARTILLDEKVKDPLSRIKPLVERFPNDGELAAFHGLSLSLDRQPEEAAKELKRALSLGVVPAKVLTSEVAEKIESDRPGMTDVLLKTLLGLGIAFGVVMLLRRAAGSRQPKSSGG